MKKLQRFLAMMMTVIMTAGTLGDAGFTVFAAEPEAEENVSEDALSEDAAEASGETAVEADAETEEDAVAEGTAEEDPAEEEPAVDGDVSKLVVNGTNMLLSSNKNSFLKENGQPYHGNLSDIMTKPYMYYDADKTTLILHDITLDGTYGVANTNKCSKGIDFQGGRLYVEIIGECKIELEGVDGEDCYGIYAGQ